MNNTEFRMTKRRVKALLWMALSVAAVLAYEGDALPDLCGVPVAMNAVMSLFYAMVAFDGDEEEENENAQQ